MPKHFLEHFEVHKKPEAIAAAKKKVRLEGVVGNTRSMPLDRSEIIQAYLGRLGRIFLHPDPEKRQRNIEILRPELYKNTVIRKENFPEAHFAYHQRLLKERGFGDMAFDAAQRE